MKKDVENRKTKVFVPPRPDMLQGIKDLFEFLAAFFK